MNNNLAFVSGGVKKDNTYIEDNGGSGGLDTGGKKGEAGAGGKSYKDFLVTADQLAKTIKEQQDEPKTTTGYQSISKDGPTKAHNLYEHLKMQAEIDEGDGSTQNHGPKTLDEDEIAFITNNERQQREMERAKQRNIQKGLDHFHKSVASMVYKKPEEDVGAPNVFDAKFGKTIQKVQKEEQGLPGMVVVVDNGDKKHKKHKHKKKDKKDKKRKHKETKSEDGNDQKKEKQATKKVKTNALAALAMYDDDSDDESD